MTSDNDMQSSSLATTSTRDPNETCCSTASTPSTGWSSVAGHLIEEGGHDDGEKAGMAPSFDTIESGTAAGAIPSSPSSSSPTHLSPSSWQGSPGKAFVGDAHRSPRVANNDISPAPPLVARGNKSPSHGQRTWRMPFTRSNRKASSSASSALQQQDSHQSNVASTSTHSVTPTPFKSGLRKRRSFEMSDDGDHRDKDENDMEDGSFVETTSATAARALARYWNEVKRRQDNNGSTVTSAATPSSRRNAVKLTTDEGTPSSRDTSLEAYIVVAREENGKKVYRIR